MKRPLALLFASLASACAYPVLFVYFHNIKEAVLGEVFSPILLFLAVACGAWLLFGWLSGTTAKGALAALLFIMVFINYSPIEKGIRTLNSDWRWPQIAPAFLFLFVNLALALRLMIKGREGDAHISRITMSLGLAFLAMILFNALNGVVTLTKARRSNNAVKAANPLREESPAAPSTHGRPNFYFFIFDEYARQDVLQKRAGYDNMPFLKGLERKGFNVSYSSSSPSKLTPVSIGNLLNFRYRYEPQTETRIDLERPPLLEVFKKAGYKTYAHTPVFVFDKDLVDVALKSYVVMAALSVKETVIARSFMAYLGRVGDKALREDRLKVFQQAAGVVDDSGEEPKFLFYHILLPHWPFVFDENGNTVPYESMYDTREPRFYTGQLRFVSRKIDELTDKIIARDPRAVILLQSDHGARFLSRDDPEEQLFCLNCLYLGGERVDIDGLGPINTLRLALNHALGLELPPLKEYP